MKDWIETGLRCPFCKSDKLWACGLEDTIFSWIDHFVCYKCGTRWIFAHIKKDIKFIDDIKNQLNDKYIWVLHTHKVGEMTLDYAPLKSETKGDSNG